MTGHWSDAPPDRVVTMARSEQQPVLLDPGYAVLRPLAEVAWLGTGVGCFECSSIHLYQRDDVVSVILLSEFRAAGWIGAFALLFNHEVSDFRECVCLLLFSSSSTISRVGSRIIFLFLDIHVACSSLFRSGLVFLHLARRSFARSGLALAQSADCFLSSSRCLVYERRPCIRAHSLQIMAYNKSFRDVPMVHGTPVKYRLDALARASTSRDKRTKKRQCGESHSGAPIARKVRGMVALERCRASSSYLNIVVLATGNEDRP